MVGFGSYLGVFLRGFLGCYPISSFREESCKIEGKEGKALLKLIIYHNLFVKVGVLNLLVLVAHIASCFFMRVSCLCYCVVLGMFVCMLGMFGRDC